MQTNTGVFTYNKSKSTKMYNETPCRPKQTSSNQLYYVDAHISKGP
jgi:hypothetical protein